MENPDFWTDSAAKDDDDDEEEEEEAGADSSLVSLRTYPSGGSKTLYPCNTKKKGGREFIERVSQPVSVAQVSAHSGGVWVQTYLRGKHAIQIFVRQGTIAIRQIFLIAQYLQL